MTPQAVTKKTGQVILFYFFWFHKKERLKEQLIPHRPKTYHYKFFHIFHFLQTQNPKTLQFFSNPLSFLILIPVSKFSRENGKLWHIFNSHSHCGARGRALHDEQCYGTGSCCSFTGIRDRSWVCFVGFRGFDLFLCFGLCFCSYVIWITFLFWKLRFAEGVFGYCVGGKILLSMCSKVDGFYEFFYVYF